MGSLEEIKRKLWTFKYYWQDTIEPVLWNSELLRNHPQAPESSNPLLHDLVVAYVDRAVETALLKLAEAEDLLKKYTNKTWGPKKNGPLEKAVWLRNKGFAHIEQARLSPSLLREIEMASHQFQNEHQNIYQILKAAFAEISSEIDARLQNALEQGALAVTVQERRFSDDEVSSLIAAANGALSVSTEQIETET